MKNNNNNFAKDMKQDLDSPTDELGLQRNESGQSSDDKKENIDAFDSFDELQVGMTLKLGKKTKICIVVMILIGVTFITLPILLTLFLSGKEQASIYDDPVVFERLGLVNMATPKPCNLQSLILSQTEMNGRSLAVYLEEAGFVDCFFSQIEIASPVDLSEQDFSDVTFLIANRVSQNAGSVLQVKFSMVDAPASHLEKLLMAMQGKQWNNLYFSSGSLSKINDQGVVLLSNLIQQQTELRQLTFRITSAPENAITKFLEALLKSRSISVIEKLGVVGQKFNDEGIFALLTVAKYAKNLDVGQPDTLLTEVAIESREDQKFIYAFKNYGDTYFHSIPLDANL